MRLFFAIVITPLIVLAQQSINYAIVPYACEKQQHAPIHIVAAVALALALAGVALAWSAWRAVGKAPPDDRGESVMPFLAVLGVIVSGLMALSISAQWLTTAFVVPCVR